MSDAYNAIMEMYGAVDFKKLIDKWERLSANVKAIPADLPIVLPDIILRASSGSGVTFLLQKLADYLEEKENLISFYGDYPFFEFLLGYVSDGDNFGEIERFNACVTQAAGFRNEFRGIIRIDIDEWMGHQDEKYFRSFLENLASNSEKWLIILTYSETDERTTRAMDVVIRSYMRVEKITLDMPESSDFVKYMVDDIFNKYDLCVEDDGIALLTETVDKLRCGNHFDGYKTVRIFGMGIVYELLSGEGDFSKCITAEMLKDFARDGEYVEKFILNLSRTNKIGFSDGGAK